MLPILVLAAALYISLAAQWLKFSRAEVFFAECTREMIAAHDWVTPLYHSHPFFDKPILTYWLIRFMFTMFGISHLTSRLPSIMAALACVFIIGIWTKNIFGKRAGVIAAMALSSSFMFISFAALCMSDMLLVLFDTAAMVLLYSGYQNANKRTLLWSAASFSIALAFLTKGPVGIVLPSLAFGSFLLVTRNLSMIKLQHLAIALCALILVGTPWFFAAYKENGLWALAYFFVRENFQRFAGSTYDTHKPIWFMVTSLMGGFAPWSIVLPVALVRDYKLIRQNAMATNPKLFLWLWVIAVVGFFSLSRGKCDYYVLPAYPAAATLVAVCLCELIKQCANSRPRMARFLKTAPSLVFGTVCLGGIIFAFCGLPLISNSMSTSLVCPLIKQTSAATHIGVFSTYASGIDEITFQTGREPVTLSSTEELSNFLNQHDPESVQALAMVPQDVYEQTPDIHCMRIIQRLNGISQPVTPGFILKRRGMLTDREPILLIANY